MTGEPTLEEILEEPIVRLLMDSDGVDAAALRELCLAVQEALQDE